MAKLKREKYEDDDDINQAIKQFNSGNQPPVEEEDKEKADAIVTGVDMGEESGDKTVVIELPVGAPRLPIINIDPEDDGTEIDIDMVDGDAPKTRIRDEDITLPECSCCGKVWFVEDGRIKNGCGCRIHPMCKCGSGKCGGHCQCKVQQETTNF